MLKNIKKRVIHSVTEHKRDFSSSSSLVFDLYAAYKKEDEEKALLGRRG